MAKRSINFKSFKQSIPFNREILNADTVKREITQKSGALKRTLTDRREALKRDDGGGRSLALTRTHKIAVAGVATLGAAAVAVSLAPSGSGADSNTVNTAPVAYSAASGKQIKDVHGSVTSEGAASGEQVKLATAHQKDAKETSEKDTKAKKAAKPVYADNLDGWIRESLHIMKKHDIPGSYDGLYRNIIRESSGDPKAINLWDVNAQNGIPSKGLLQVIPPTFKSYHVAGTSWDIYNPVANITAAANYAADRYGTMDNVDSAY
jgi:hypothetical protein